MNVTFSRTSATLSAVLLAACAAAEPPPVGPVPPGVDFVTREDWGANSPIKEMVRHTPERITIHHSGWLQRPERALESKLHALQSYAQLEFEARPGRRKAAWADVPYHFFIDHAGRVAEGRPVHYAGITHERYEPVGHLSIVVEGNFQLEKPGTEQLEALRRVVAWAAHRWDVPAGEIRGHLDYADTASPGRYLKRHLPKLRALAERQRD